VSLSNLRILSWLLLCCIVGLCANIGFTIDRRLTALEQRVQKIEESSRGK
jgi:hypothetical protein